MIGRGSGGAPGPNASRQGSRPLRQISPLPACNPSACCAKRPCRLTVPACFPQAQLLPAQAL